MSQDSDQCRDSTRLNEVCSKIWGLFNKDDSGEDERISALKAVLCVPGALYELQQEAEEQQLQDREDARLVPGGASLLANKRSSGPKDAPLNFSKPAFGFLETLLLPSGKDPGTHLVSLASFQDAVWLSLHQATTSPGSPGHYFVAMLLTVVMLMLSALAALVVLATPVSPYIVLLPALGLGPFIGVLVVMALDAKEPVPAPTSMLLPAHSQGAQHGGPGRISIIAQGLGWRMSLGNTSFGLCSPAGGAPLLSQQRSGRRLRCGPSSAEAKTKAAPLALQQGGEVGKGHKDLPDFHARGSLDAQGRYHARGRVEDPKQRASVKAQQCCSKGGASLQNQYDPRSSLDALGGHAHERGSFKSHRTGRCSIPEDAALRAEDFQPPQQPPQHKQQQEQEQQREQQQQELRADRPLAMSLPLVGRVKGLRRSLDALFRSCRSEDSGEGSSHFRPRGLSIDNHSLFGGTAWKGAASRLHLPSVRRSSSMSMTSSSEDGSDTLSNPWNMRARHVYETALKERVGKVMAVLLSPPHELRLEDVRDLYEELEGNELRQLPSLVIDDAEAERELEERARAKEEQEKARAAQNLEAEAPGSGALREPGSSTAADSEDSHGQQQEQQLLQQSSTQGQVVSSPFKPPNPTQKAYSNTNWAPQKQVLAEARARAEHKQAKAKALWQQHQAKRTQGPLLKSVMGDRDLFYQVSREDDEEDDAPINKHSPLVEEQLAAVRAEAEAEAAAEQMRADAAAQAEAAWQESYDAAQAKKEHMAHPAAPPSQLGAAVGPRTAGASTTAAAAAPTVLASAMTAAVPHVPTSLHRLARSSTSATSSSGSKASGHKQGGVKGGGGSLLRKLSRRFGSLKGGSSRGGGSNKGGGGGGVKVAGQGG